MTSPAQPLHVLNLARWYPNRTDSMPGLFVQRHVEAVARYAKVALVYAHGVEAETSVPLYEVDYRKMQTFAPHGFTIVCPVYTSR